MKKKDIKETPEVLAEQPAVDAKEETPATVETPEAEKAPKAPKKTKKEVEVQEIPSSVDRILAAFPQYKELYVDKQGGTFVKDTQPNLVEGAILYQNPHYKQ